MNRNNAFTLVEATTHVGTWKGSCKGAFTLAEVLITLGVIGVVAAITMPTVIANINERVNSERHANIAMKVTQAMEQMRAHGLLNNTYPSTESFVDELQKYLKIAKRCDSEHIAECWPTEKVIDSNGDEFEISKAELVFAE
ncbi:prepilin-type N-terminal cleavage/methylation domain-containing protein [bacterium]|nr:prepilin-type N-terminal cleavage/methylation domain-containing protein [bacterium]